MRWVYVMVFLLFLIIGIAVVRTYQLSGAAQEPVVIIGAATPTRSTVARIEPTPVKPTPVPATPIPSTPVPPPPQPEGNLPGNGAMVKWVDVPSAANHVGIKQFDVITVFDGTPVDTNHFLVNLIQSKKPGDFVDLTVVRGGQLLQLSTQLRGSPRDNNVAYLGVQYVQQGSAPKETE